MAAPKMSREWEEFAATGPRYINHSEPLATVRENINKQSLDNIALLKEPALAALADNVTTRDFTITLPEVSGHEFCIRVYYPSRVDLANSKLPLMLYFHNGYWSTGNLDGDELGCRAIIGHGNDLVIVSFEYRLAPENSFETILLDAEYSLKWLYQNAKEYGGDVGRGFFVGGATAGAHLAAIIAVRARNRLPEIKIDGQCLIVPTVLAWTGTDSIPEKWSRLVTSHTENAEAPLLTEKEWQKYLALLNVPENKRDNGESFPVWADLKGLPPTYLAMDGPDPIRDEGYLYEMLLRKAGVQTRTDHYDMPNWFVQFPALPTTGRAGIELATGVRWLLEVGRYTF